MLLRRLRFERVSEQFRFFAFSPDQYDSGRAASRIAEMEAMKRNIAQAEWRLNSRSKVIVLIRIDR